MRFKKGIFINCAHAYESPATLIAAMKRVKALGALYEMLGGGDENEAAEFLQALEQAGEEREPWRE